MSGYCTRADLVAFLPSGGLPNAARLATGNAMGDYIELDQHGLVDDQAVIFSADSGYAVPTGLTAGTTYYAIVVSSSRFKVAAAPSGAAIDLTTAGNTFSVWTELPWDSWIEAGARDVDGVVAALCGAHTVPIVAPYPQVVVLANAELAAARGLGATGGAEIDYGAKLEAIQRRLTPWAKALPLRGSARSNTSPANLAITASAGAIDPRGWARNGNEVLP